MPNDDNIFERIEGFGSDLGGRFEWSLRLAADEATVRDNVVFWLDAGITPAQEAGPESFSSLLEQVGSPSAIRNIWEARCRCCLHQGVGFSATGANDWRLYLHRQSKPFHADEYTAYHWPPRPWQQATRYSFFFFPETPSGETPENWIHPDLLPVYRKVQSDELLQAISGFWLRRNHAGVDQVCLTFPWQPAVRTYLGLLKAFVTGAAARKVLKRYASHHFRHLTFATSRQQTPTLTLYFSGTPGKLPRDMEELQSSVQVDARRCNELLLAGLPGRSSLRRESAERMERFYTPGDSGVWRKALGRDMHYHFGLFTAEDDLKEIWNDAPFERGVSELIPYIPAGSNVYDLGCGWGGPAAFLAKANGCDITGITASRAQFRYCDALGLKCRYGDMETTLPPGRFDILLMLESLEHVEDKASLLKTLRQFGSRLVIRTHCQEGDADGSVFDGTMHLVSAQDLKALLQGSGWKITHWNDRREASMPTVEIWHKRLCTIPPQNDEHFEAWRRFCSKIMCYPEEWASFHPLIEAVAEPDCSASQGY